MLGIQVQVVAGQAVEGTVEHADDFRRFIVDDALLAFVPQHRHGDAAGVVRCVGGVALMQETQVVEFVASGAVGLIEGPAVFQHQVADHRHIDQIFQALELAQDQRAVRPGAGQGYIQMVASGLGGKTAVARGAGAAVGGHPVAALRLLALEGAVLAFIPLVLPAALDQQTHLDLLDQ
ncbi:hypothetical protein D3C78_1298400 [compost metagenome]